MKKIALSLALFSLNSFAGDISVKSFSVLRQGGGQMEAVVTLKNSSLSVMTTSCSFHQLSQEEQAKTVFSLSGATAFDAMKIFSNEAILAADESIQDNIQTGTWNALNLTYDYIAYDGSVDTRSRSISQPIIIIGGEVSQVIGRIEAQARKAAKDVCP